MLLDNISSFYKSSFLVNPAVYEKIFDKLQLQKTYGDCKELKVLDIYPGPGQQSLIFNEKFRPKQHLLMDDRPKFTKFWKNHLQSSHLQMSTLNPFDWESYLMLIDYQKIFQPEKQPRSHINDKFLVMANVTDKKYEGLIMQWYNCIGQKNWLQRYGRVKMLIWVPTSTAIKLLAKPGFKARSRASLVAETFTESSLIAMTDDTEVKKMDPEVMQEHNPILINHNDTVPNKKLKIPMALLSVSPRDFNVDKENWDYVTKQLMIQKITPFKDSVESLGPGGKDYFIKQINSDEFMERSPGSFTAQEYIKLTDIFSKWPFKPDIFMSFFNPNQEE